MADFGGEFLFDYSPAHGFVDSIPEEVFFDVSAPRTSPIFSISPTTGSSITRTATIQVDVTDDQNALITRARKMISSYEDMAELIRLGAYRRGSDPQVDQAIAYQPALENFLRQDMHEGVDYADCLDAVRQILGAP